MPSTSYDPENKIWSGAKVSPTYNPDQNLGNLVLTALHNRSSEIAQICADTGVAITCSNFRERAISMALYFKNCNLKDGEFVGFVTYNTENLTPTVVGCFLMGIPICPLSPTFTSHDITKTFAIIKPSIIFCDTSTLTAVQESVLEMKTGTKIVTVMEKVSGHDCATEIMKNAEFKEVEDFVAPNIDSATTAAVICSSGSTGTPKRIIKTHRELIAGFGTGWKLNRKNPAVFFNFSQLFWISGFNSSIYTILNHSTNVITSSLALPAVDLINILQTYKVTHTLTLPFTISSILEVPDLKPFEYMESWMISGFAATKSLCKKFAPYVPRGRLWITYGLTEKYIISCNMTGDYDHIGFLNDNIEIKLIDSNGNQVGPNEHGEICIRDDPKFSGYHLDPVRTADKVKDGWFHTSDIGYFDDENALRFVDRKVELMNFEGYYIIPHEMESIINEVDGVVGSSIVGVLERESFNYIIHAFIIPDKSKNLNESDVLEYVHSKVIEQRQIRGGVHFVESLPVGKTGKVDRMKLREMAMNLENPEVAIVEG